MAAKKSDKKAAPAGKSRSGGAKPVAKGRTSAAPARGAKPAKSAKPAGAKSGAARGAAKPAPKYAPGSRPAKPFKPRTAEESAARKSSTAPKSGAGRFAASKEKAPSRGKAQAAPKGRFAADTRSAEPRRGRQEESRGRGSKPVAKGRSASSSTRSRQDEQQKPKIRSASYDPNRGLVKRTSTSRSYDDKPARGAAKRTDSRPARKDSRYDDRPASRGRTENNRSRSERPEPSGDRGRGSRSDARGGRSGPKPATSASTYKRVERDSTMATKTANPKKTSPVASSSRSAADAVPPAKPRTKLRADDMRKLRDMMLQERQRIIDEMRILDDRSLQSSSDDNGQQPGFSLQLADSASDNIQIETDLGIRNIEAEQLAQIDEALRAMEGGEYGVCNRCHEPISIERLFARPNAKYCISCLKLLEAGKA